MNVSFTKKLLTVSLLGLVNLCSLAHAEPNAGKTYTFAWKNHSEPNQTFTIGGENDRIYVIETYFNACVYCQKNAPLVKKLVDEQSVNPRVTIVDLSRDTRQSDYASWISKHQPKQPVLQNGVNENNFLAQYVVRGYPTTFVLDCNLNVVAKFEGAWDASDEAKIRENLKTLQASSCVVQ